MAGAGETGAMGCHDEDAPPDEQEPAAPAAMGAPNSRKTTGPAVRRVAEASAAAAKIVLFSFD